MFEDRYLSDAFSLQEQDFHLTFYSEPPMPERIGKFVVKAQHREGGN
jgi:hypothetical protein